jgi:quinol-cytochrome oxidoreductase complex cytochrome b subunit/cytochrome c
MHLESERPGPSGFWQERTGWRQLKQLLFLEPLPGGARWTAAFGSLLLFAFVLQVLTGVLLALNYSPSTETAYPSVQYIQDEVPFGALVRALHHWGSSAMVVLLLVHLVQVFVWGAYKRPRELTWMVGVLLLVLTLGLAFTGYLLPWDQKAYWATRVGLGIASTTPGIGGDLRTLLQGGPEMGDQTLTRFFGLHGFVLPGLMVLLIVVHVYLFRVHGVTPSWWQSAEQLRAREEPFWPQQAFMDAVFALVFLVGLGLWAYLRPAPLGEPADPSRLYEARPEWYFMFLFQLLRYFEGPDEVVGTFVLPTLLFLVLFFWPFLDRILDWLWQRVLDGLTLLPARWGLLRRVVDWLRVPSRNPLRRPLAMALLVLGTTGLVGLTVFAIATDVRMREPEVAAVQAPAAVERPGPLQRADVARLYGDNCAACHGVDGTAGKVRLGMPSIPDFTSMAWQLSRTDVEITHRIQDGSAPLMPAYRDKLTTQQMLALAIYVRAFATSPGAVGLGPRPPEGKKKVAKGPAKKQVTAGMPPAQLYGDYCAACHDTDGRGGKLRPAMPDMPDFASAKWQRSRKDAELEHSILGGKGKFMVPMKDKGLGPADAEKLVAIVRDFGRPDAGKEKSLEKEGKEKEKALKKERKEKEKALKKERKEKETERLGVATVLYRQNCLVCHGADGRGLDMRAGMTTLPDFTSAMWQKGGNNPGLTASILDGKGTLMPPFRDRVTEDQARDLVAYVRAFGPEPPPPEPPPETDLERRFRELRDQWYEVQRQLRELSEPPRKQ